MIHGSGSSSSVKPMTYPNAEPLVAILTPVYNGARFLAETMEAVQAQDYGNLIHIVLDNASTDDTPTILARFERARVPVKTARNKTTLPMNDNWNAAVTLIPPHACYFSIVCADDLIAPSYVRKTVNVAERNPQAGLVGCLFHYNTEVAIDPCWPSDCEVFPGREAVASYLRGQRWMPSAHVLFRSRELAHRCPFFRDILANDLAAVLDVLMQHDLGFVHEDLAMTRLHDETLSSAALDRDRRHLYEWFLFLREYGPQTLGAKAAREFTLLYRRYYLRQLIKWRAKGARDVYKLQMDGLRSIDAAPRLADFADALWDWVMVCADLRHVWSGYPFHDAD